MWNDVNKRTRSPMETGRLFNPASVTTQYISTLSTEDKEICSTSFFFCID